MRSNYRIRVAIADDEDEAHCHRSILRALLTEKGAKVG